jgi:hypothetical protein
MRGQNLLPSDSAPIERHYTAAKMVTRPPGFSKQMLLRIFGSIGLSPASTLNSPRESLLDYHSNSLLSNHSADHL